MSDELPTGLTGPEVGLRRSAGLRTAAALAAVLGVVLTEGAGSAGAASATVRFACTFSGLGGASMTASIVWNASDTYTVGRSTPRVPIEATTAVDPLVPQSLRAFGATSIQGSAEAATVVTAPGGDIDRTLPLDIPVTQLPSSGPLTLKANGAMPPLRFTRAGTARVAVGDVTLHLTPRRADGSPTQLGTVNASCQVDSGQSGTVTSLRILPAPRPQPTPTGSGAAGGGAGSGSGSGPGSSGGASGAGAGRGTSRSTGPSGSPGPSRTPDPSGSVTASGTPKTSKAAVPRGAPTVGSPEATSDLRTSAQDRTPLPAWLRAAAGVLAVAAVAFASALWFRRRRGEDG
ncbi:DUF6801 domain-containing protein [Streptomyces sp. NPDC002677]|uniref:DUF6801 domain-containing protein n=1 Tax=Streptomyces sp. NPDC002677 TaxID=3154774 RepID=UPI0033179138